MGTRPQELCGVSDDTTTVSMYPQAIPGHDDRLVCVGTCHFPQGGCLGAIMLIDLKREERKRGPDPDEADYRMWDDRYAVTNITPTVFVERRTEPGWHFRTAQGTYVHDRNGQRDLFENGGTGRAQQVIHYPTDIQPIFDAKCVTCHGKEDPDGDLNLTGDVTDYYSVSYEELCRKQLAGPLISEFTTFRRGDQGNYCGATLPPKSLGTQKSVLADMLTNAKHPKNRSADHSRMLTDMELMVLNRWIDSNYQFYGTYYGRHHGHWVNADPQNSAYHPESDFRRKALFVEAVSVAAPKWHH